VKNDDLEAGMRELEWFHDLRVLPATWPVIRVDGRSFIASRKGSSSNGHSTPGFTR